MTTTGTTVLAKNDNKWDGAAGAWLAEVARRTGSPRTPQEYGRYLTRFLELVGDPAQATTAHVHAFACGTGPSAGVSLPRQLSLSAWPPSPAFMTSPGAWAWWPSTPLPT